MRITVLLAVAVPVCLATWGCQNSTSGERSENRDPGNVVQGQASTAEHSTDRADPGTTVAAFLQALCDGDEERAGALLTVKAREETAKMDLAVKPPGSPTAKFDVGQVQYLGQAKDRAHVLSTWTDKNRQGAVESHEITWILRLTENGWAIAGMAARLFEDQMPLVFNFEDPEDMLKQRRRAEQEMVRRTYPQQRQALAPAGPPSEPVTR